MRALRLNLKVRDISFPVRCLTKYVVSGQFLLVLCHILQIICFLRFITFSFPQVLTAQDLVDFSPVYRCLHIYSVLVCMTLKDLLLFFFFFSSWTFFFIIIFLQASIFLPVVVVLDEPDEMYIPWTQGMTAYFILYAL